MSKVMPQRRLPERRAEWVTGDAWKDSARAIFDRPFQTPDPMSQAEDSEVRFSMDRPTDYQYFSLSEKKDLVQEMN